jgi:hypothetical protein
LRKATWFTPPAVKNFHAWLGEADEFMRGKVNASAARANAETRPAEPRCAVANLFYV